MHTGTVAPAVGAVFRDAQVDIEDGGDGIVAVADCHQDGVEELEVLERCLGVWLHVCMGSEEGDRGGGQSGRLSRTHDPLYTW